VLSKKKRERERMIRIAIHLKKYVYEAGIAVV
jgi:hypothetical protein